MTDMMSVDEIMRLVDARIAAREQDQEKSEPQEEAPPDLLDKTPDKLEDQDKLKLSQAYWLNMFAKHSGLLDDGYSVLHHFCLLCTSYESFQNTMSILINQSLQQLKNLVDLQSKPKLLTPLMLLLIEEKREAFAYFLFIFSPSEELRNSDGKTVKEIEPDRYKEYQAARPKKR